jgi:hypothetical protein
MGATIDALSHGVKNVQENPKLVTYSYVLMMLAFVLAIPLGIFAFVLVLIPVVGAFFARPVMIIPLKTLMLGGMVGLAGAAFAGSVEFEDLTETYKEHGLSLAAAFAIQELVVVLFSFVLVVVLFVVVFGGTMSLSAVGSSAGGSELAAAGFGIAVIGLYVAALVVLFAITAFFQFLDVAVVLGDHGPGEAVKECWRLVRNGPVSVAGYTLMRGLLGGVILLPGYVLAIVGSEVFEPLTWVGFVVILLLYPVAMAVLMSYHAAYYGHRLKAR